MVNFSPAEISRYYSARMPGLKQLKARAWRGKCPVHAGNDDNFSVDPQTGAAYCHSQCGKGWDILGLEMELSGTAFPAAKKESYEIMGRPLEDGEQGFVATYEYQEENGNVRYQVVRMYPKEFKQRRKEGGSWVWNLRGVERLPYNLIAVNAGTFCILVEGEADVECLRSHGIVASCNNGGAGNWDPALNRYFEGKRLLLIPDNDDPGREHMLKVAAQVGPKAAKIQILQLPGLQEKGDVRDWFNRGGSVEELRKLVNSRARDWTPDFEFAAAESPEDKWVNSPRLIVEASGGRDSAWDLAAEDGIPTPYPHLTDLLTGGMRNQEVYYLAGRRGSGKTSMLLQFVTKALEINKGVLFFSLEMRDIDVLRRLVSIEESVDLAQVRILQKKRHLNEIKLDDLRFLESLESRLKARTDKLQDSPLLVHQKPVVTPEYIVSESRRLAKGNKIDLICIDHMQLMGSDGDEKKEYDRFTHISRALKTEVARELNLPILVASQVTRAHASDGREDKDELEITDMRGSGALEEDAAGIMLLYHSSEDAKKAKKEGRLAKGPVKATLKLGKNRFGVSPEYMEMIHYKRCTTFEHDESTIGIDRESEEVA